MPSHRPLCFNEIHFVYFCEATPNKDAAILYYISTVTLAVRRSSIIVYCAGFVYEKNSKLHLLSGRLLEALSFQISMRRDDF